MLYTIEHIFNEQKHTDKKYGLYWNNTRWHLKKKYSAISLCVYKHFLKKILWRPHKKTLRDRKIPKCLTWQNSYTHLITDIQWVFQSTCGNIEGYIDGLVQDCSNSIANALELLQFCTKPSYDKHGNKSNQAERNNGSGTARVENGRWVKHPWNRKLNYSKHFNTWGLVTHVNTSVNWIITGSICGLSPV